MPMNEPLDFLKREGVGLPDEVGLSPTEMENGVGVKLDKEGGSLREGKVTVGGELDAAELLDTDPLLVSALIFLRTNKRI